MRTRRMSGMRRSVVGPVAAFGAILLLLGAGRLEAGDPWLAPPFSLSAEELLRWGADARPPEAGKPLRLFDEVRTTFDAAGKRTLTFRRVQMVPDRGAIEGVGPIEAFWQPWKDLPPVLRGRVVRPDGSTSDLDQGSVADRPFKSEPGMFDDRRIRNAPLQGLEPGGVAEWETVVVEKEGFPGGRSGRLFLSNRNPARCLRVVIQVPVSSRLRWAIRGIPSFEPKVSSSGERTTYTFELLDAPASLEWEKGLPRDVVLLPWLDFSVEESWEAMAALYSSLSAAALRSLDPASLKGFPDVSKASEKEKVAQILDAIRRNVRYTGLEFGLSAWIPADPRVTWERRFGDCKDQAALLVSLLRHVGVEADVALLRAGSRDDIEPEVPSLRLFDHAIVRIASVPPVWIDPTSAFDPVGRVPVGEEGRRALVCRSGVKELEAIPFTSVRDNMWISRIEVRLSDEGPGAFKEVRESTGWIDSSQRATYDRLNEAERKKFLESIAAGRFGREASLARFEASPPRDLSRPFLVTIDGSKAGVAQTSHSEAVVAVDPSLVFGTLPAVAGERRRQDLAYDPFTARIEYHVVPPPGFVSRPLPEPKTRAVGAAVLSSSFSTRSDGSVDLVIQLALEGHRLSPEGALEMHKAVEEIQAEKKLLVAFDHRAAADLSAGKYREAIEELKRLQTSYPTAADPHRRMSLALLAVGLGQPARREAERATELEPGSKRAWQQLGIALQHDPFGRERRRGWDREKALAALDRGLKIDPEDPALQRARADLLRHGEDGLVERDAGLLAASLAQYKRLLNARPDLAAIRVEYVVTLLRAGLGAAALEATGGWEEKDAKFAKLRIAARAMQGGKDDAMDEARRLFPEADARREALAEAGAFLISTRKYDLSSALFGEAARGYTGAVRLGEQADIWRRVVRSEDRTARESGPVEVVRRYKLRLLERQAPSWYAARQDFVEALAKRKDLPAYRQIANTTRYKVKAMKGEMDLLADFSSSTSEYVAEGNEIAGWKVATTPVLGDPGQEKEVYWVVREGGADKIAGGPGLGEVHARYALSLVQKGKVEEAALVLDRFESELIPEKQAAGSGMARAFYRQLWTDDARRDPRRIRLACAAALVDLGEIDDDLLRELETAQRGDPDDRVVALLRAGALQVAEKWGDLVDLGLEWRRREPEAREWQLALVSALWNRGRRGEAEEMARGWIELHPGDAQMKRTFSGLLSNIGETERAISVLDEILSSASALPGDYNNQAWSRMVAGKADQVAVELAAKAVEGTWRRPSALNTLAAIYAEQGRPDEARALVLEAMERSGSDEPSSADWYVLGRILEDFGLAGDADAAYERVKKEDGEESVWRLADRRRRARKPQA